MVEIDLALLERIAEQRRFEPRTLELAKRLFIHRETPKRLAVEHGLNVQRLYAIRREILQAAQVSALPTGWEEVTLAGPADVIAEIRERFAAAMARLGSGSGSGSGSESESWPGR